MRLGVIGHLGMVGAAVAKAFSASGFVVNGFDIREELPLESHYEAVLGCPIVFVCVPSPTVNGQQDLSAVRSALEQLSNAQYRGVVVLKSTVLPGTTAMLAATYSLNLIHNPEFLRAAKAYADFLSQPVVLLGGPLKSCETVRQVYRLALPQAICFCYDNPAITETAKYMRNNFLAVKVAFANEFAQLCSQTGIDYSTVLKAMLSQGGVERGHWNVPGPDGKPGYSGMCFPKDARAMIAFMTDLGIQHGVISGAETDNQTIRPHGPNCEEICNEV